MSRFISIAEKMKTVLDGVTALDGVDVIVDRQKDIENEIVQSCSKASGAAITIMWAGAKDEQPGHRGLKLVSSYAVAVSTLPFVKEGSTAMKADNLVEEVIKALHGWSPTAEGNCKWTAKFSAVEMVPHQNLLIYELQFNVLT